MLSRCDAHVAMWLWWSVAGRCAASTYPVSSVGVADMFVSYWEGLHVDFGCVCLNSWLLRISHGMLMRFKQHLDATKGPKCISHDPTLHPQSWEILGLISAFE